MKFKKIILNAAGTFLLLSVVLVMGSGPTFASEMCQIIKIEKGIGGAESRIKIFPEKITVPVGTCIIWVNWVIRGEVQISFRENAKQCITSTDSPSGFKEGELKVGESCYFTESLPLGKTASLYWNKPGVYKYTIELVGAGKEGLNPGNTMVVGIIEVK